MFRIIFRAGILSVSTFFILFSSVRAQEPDSTGLNLKVRVLGTEDLRDISGQNEVKIVSASRSGKSIQDLPFTAYVVTKEEIARNGYTSLTDVLKMVPGIRTIKSFSGPEGEGFMMRGLIGNQYVKILLNDMPLQPSVSGNMVIGEQLPIQQAERIEIIFGPSSAVYGADAMAGVINIITKEADHVVFAEADVSAGSNKYRNSNFLVGGKAGSDKNIVKYTIYGTFGKQDDQNIKYEDGNLYNPRAYIFRNIALRPEDRKLIEQNPELLNFFTKLSFPYYTGTTDKVEFDELPRESRQVGIHLEYRNLRISFNENYFKNHSSIGRDPLLFGYHEPSAFIGTTSRQIALRYQKKIRSTLWTANLSYLRYRMDNHSSLNTNYLNGKNGKAYFYSASDDIYGEVLINRVLWNRLEATAGLTATFSGVLPTLNELSEPFDESLYTPFSLEKQVLDPFLGDFGYHPQNYVNAGAFVQLFWTKNRWTLTGGLRADKHSDYEGSFYTRLAGLYRLNDKHNFRFSLGSGFKAPSPDLLYASTAFRSSDIDDELNIFPIDSINYEQVPNPALEREIYQAYELGYRFTPSKNWEFDFSFNTGRIHQMISGKLQPIDRSTYPLAVREGPFSFSRVFVNDEESDATAFSLQAALRGRNIVPSIGLGLDCTATYTTGSETLPDGGGSINELRMVPPLLLQARLYGRWRNFYVNIENVYSSAFYRRFIQNSRVFERPESLLNAYFTTDIMIRKQISDQFGFYLQVGNLFDTKYGGIGATGLDIDLLYNPQPGRTFRAGVSFRTL